VDGFCAANTGQVFLSADPAVANFVVGFSAQADRSGALISPDLSLSGLSRITGPVSGDIGIASAGSFDPVAWFGAITTAKLFGVLKLSDLLEVVGFNEIEKIPQFTGQSLNAVERLLSNLGRLNQQLSVDQIPQTASIVGLLNQLTDPGTGSIAGLL